MSKRVRAVLVLVGIVLGPALVVAIASGSEVVLGLAPYLPLSAAAAVLASYAARRYAAQQRRLGSWDERGPLYESDPPPAKYVSFGMERVLELHDVWHSTPRRRDEGSSVVEEDTADEPSNDHSS